MKRNATLLLLFGMSSLLLLGFPTRLAACNLTSLTELSTTAGPGANYTIDLRVCIGYGLTGATKGANANTRTFAFAWYTTQTSPTFSISSYSPTSISSTVTTPNCTMTSVNINNPPGPYTGAKIGTFFVAPASCTNGFLCVTSTPNCGNIAQACYNFSFVVNGIPDSIRVFGLEGNGNPVAGCYPDADMVVYPSLSRVMWGGIGAVTLRQSIEITWSTLQEVNSDLFYLERMQADGEFEMIGSIPANGNSRQRLDYTFNDVRPNVGLNRYRVVQISKDAVSTESPTVEASFDPSVYSWGAVGPVPTDGYLRLNFLSPTHESDLKLQLVDVTGKVVQERTISANSGTNAIDMDLSTVQAGIYFVRLKTKSSILNYKIVKG